MHVTDDMVAQFRTEGWVAIPAFWEPREVEAMRAELARLREQGKLRNVATDGDGRTHSQTQANLQLCPMWPHSACFRAMPFVPKVAETVEALIGGPVMLHLDQVFLKPGMHGAGTNWHQDNAYFQIPDPLKGTALWTAVHDATVANGTLRVIPRAFRDALPHDRDPYSDHHIRCWPDDARAVPVEIPAGGIVLFAYGTPHATGANTTPHERAGIAHHFINGDQDGVARSGFEPGKRPWLTGPSATGGEREWGVCLTHAWRIEVERALADAP